jgi:hypothetical protein
MNNGAALLRRLIFDDADVIGATARRSQMFQDGAQTRLLTGTEAMSKAFRTPAGVVAEVVLTGRSKARAE